MKIIEWNEFAERGLQGSGAFTIGVFDGVHRGHQALIKAIVEYGKGTTPIVITFRVNHKNDVKNQLLGFEQKIEIFENLGVKLCVAADLNNSFKHIGGEVFFNILREKGKMRFLAVGKNFRCGYKLDTDAEQIKRINDSAGIETFIMEPVMEGSLPVSSSRIRKAVSEGRLEEAAKLLGRPY